MNLHSDHLTLWATDSGLEGGCTPCHAWTYEGTEEEIIEAHAEHWKVCSRALWEVSDESA